MNLVRSLRHKLSDRATSRQTYGISVSAHGEGLLKMLLGDDADLLPLELCGVEHTARGNAVTFVFRGRLTNNEVEVAEEKRQGREAGQLKEEEVKQKEDGDD